MSSLFRKEAVEHQKDRLMGEVLLLQPISLVILTVVSVIVAVFIAAILYWGSYARRETVHGYLVPDSGIVKLYASSPGIISKSFVKEGEQVKEGAPLFTILAERRLEAGKDLSVVQLDEIQQAIFNKQKQIANTEAFSSLELERLEAQIQSVQAEINETVKTLTIQNERLSLAQKRVEGVKKLHSHGHISESDYQKVLEEWLSLQQQQQELNRNLAAKRMNLEQALKERAQFPLRNEEKLSELSSQVGDLKRQQAEIQGRYAYEIHAPVSGTVTSVQAKYGQWQNQNMHLVSIVPENVQLEAELFIPTRAIGFVQENQAVRLRYEAFPYQRFGIYKGKVKSVSKNILHPAELQVPFELREPVYKVVVTLDSQDVNAYGQSYALQSGIMLEADVILDKRSLFEWILEPLYILRGRL